MNYRFTKWLRDTLNRIITSIAFYPVLIVIGFLLLSYVMLELDFSETGKHFKASYTWIRLKDASTARSIVSTIAGGVISLMVFSFSMVMILLNQAASQMSNRMLESMIGNRFQQLVLGTYIGTIVYSLFLLSTIRDIESGIYVPALSIYLLVFITIADIFVFIYFLHYVTQSVKFETIIERVRKQTLGSLKNCHIEQPEEIKTIRGDESQLILTVTADVYQGFNCKSLMQFSRQNNGLVQLLHPPGTYLLEDQPIAKWIGKKLTGNDVKDLLFTLDFYPGQSEEQNYYFGFHQLAEVSLKALSPGINDPQTAVLSLRALSELFSYRLNHHPRWNVKDETGKTTIIINERTFEELFAVCIYPIWDYGNNDRYIQQTLYNIITQLQSVDLNKTQYSFLGHMLKKVKEKIEEKEIESQLGNYIIKTK